MKVLVASRNPVKLQACQQAFEHVFPLQEVVATGMEVKSGVSDQPKGTQETRQGAENRVQELLQRQLKADFYVGIEGGITQIEQSIYAFAWIVVSNGTQKAEACTAHFQLPDKVTELIHSGLELGDANDQVFGEHNSKQKGGAIGLLTEESITRKALYIPAVEMALIPFRPENASLYGKQNRRYQVK